MNKPWKYEPNRLETEINGYPALIIRTKNSHLCGYIGIPETHKFYGVDYSEIPAYVHGGLTYGDYGNDDHIGELYYKPKENNDGNNLYWLGFDCAHAGDYTPGSYESMLDAITKKYISEGYSYIKAVQLAKENKDVKLFKQSNDETYRTIGYVLDELVRLASQLD
jgi:hypothetical protein